MFTPRVLSALAVCAALSLVVACGGIPTTTAPKATRPKADDELQAKREKLINDLQRRGLVKEIKPKPSGTTELVVTSAFMLLDASGKKAHVELCYAWSHELPQGQEPSAFADLRPMNLIHATTGKQVGTYHPTLGLSMD